MNKLND